MTPEELTANVCPKIRDIGWAFYFVPATLARGEELGLDGFRFYFLGRGGVLGNVEAGVVSAAFGYFNPALVAQMWNSGKEIVDPRVAGTAFMGCSAALGRDRLSGVAGLDAFVAAADAVNDAADPMGLALYSAIKAEPLVDDLPGRAMQLVTVLREFRGSAHLIALRASGLTDKVAHFITRPSDVAMFGWTDADAPVIGDAEHATRRQAELLTDALVLPAYSVLDDAGRSALTAGIDAIAAALK